ncbi:MAG: fumarylacetoacetate hydrolase family protein [Kiritimatiellae bacterium]|nr:fumarylacetoacetate hydrolase family protein [Kiritimatiellia bacterium]
MKLVRYQTNGAARYGILEEDWVFAIEGDPYADDIRKGQAVGGVEAVPLLAPCDPKAIISIGANYESRCKENNLPLPTVPGKGDRFLIGLDSLTGPGGLIYLPSFEKRVDYSGELAIVMRRTCRHITPEQAPNYILGYTVVHNAWAKGKLTGDEPVPPEQKRKYVRAYESFCPVGPWVETDIDPSGIAWQTRVNGEVRQNANTSDMIFGVRELVAGVSEWHTLEPGDVIQTGTACGVGPMTDGDVIEIEFDGIGVLRNRAVRRDGMQPIDLVFIDKYEGK